MPYKHRYKENLGTVVAHPIPAMTPDQLCWAVIGKSMGQLVREIVENQDGRYNALYTMPVAEATP